MGNYRSGKIDRYSNFLSEKVEKLPQIGKKIWHSWGKDSVLQLSDVQKKVKEVKQILKLIAHALVSLRRKTYHLIEVRPYVLLR